MGMLHPQTGVWMLLVERLCPRVAEPATTDDIGQKPAGDMAWGCCTAPQPHTNSLQAATKEMGISTPTLFL